MEPEHGRIGAWPGPAPQVPEQLHWRPHSTPEQRLMAAVLEDAMRELTRPGGGWYGARARRQIEVQRWLESDDVAWPFSFVNVCEALDLDPGEVRSCLGRSGGSHRGPVRR
jgi:hypothetical protein